MPSVSVTYAMEMLELWRDCERVIASGTAKSYKIGTREYTSLDLSDITARIQYWERQVDILSGNKGTGRSRQVVFRD